MFLLKIEHLQNSSFSDQIKNMNKKADWFFTKKSQWQEAYIELRTFVLGCGLTEELKWGCPCYTLNKNNVVLIHGFKNYCALLFMKGVLIPDPNGILIQQTETFNKLDKFDLKALQKLYNFGTP